MSNSSSSCHRSSLLYSSCLLVSLLSMNYLYTTIKKKKRRHVTSLSDQHLILSILHFSKFLQISQNMKYIINYQKRFNKLLFSITHFLSFEGSHFDTKFNRKIARLMDQIWRQSASVQRKRRRLIISNARAQEAQLPQYAQQRNQSLQLKATKANLCQC